MKFGIHFSTTGGYLDGPLIQIHCIGRTKGFGWSTNLVWATGHSSGQCRPRFYMGVPHKSFKAWYTHVKTEFLCHDTKTERRLLKAENDRYIGHLFGEMLAYRLSYAKPQNRVSIMKNLCRIHDKILKSSPGVQRTQNNELLNFLWYLNDNNVKNGCPNRWEN